MRENKYMAQAFSFFILWTLVLLISFLLNSHDFANISLTNKLALSHIFIWLLGKIVIIILFVKIHKQKLTIDGMKENQNSFFDIYNFFTTPTLVIDKSSNEIIMANDVAMEQFSIDKNDKHIKIDKLDCLFEGILKYKDSIIRNIQLENTCYDENGNESTFEVFLHDLFYQNRYVTLAVIADITEGEADKNLREMTEYIEDLQAKDDALEDNAFELIQLTIKLEESEKNLREANQNKDKFFSIVAHDLKSPFVGLLGITEMMVNDYEDLDEKERREFIHSLYDISKSTYELLEGLLEWARAKQGRMEYSPREFNFFQLAESLTNLLKANAYKKDIKLINSVDIATMLFADRDMISTVLRNLLANAIKFTPQSGSVEIQSEVDNDFLKISVIDTGIGINKTNQEKLFRIDVNHTTLGTNQEKGTGLGLILCKELIQKHNGTIWVESELGKGSKFIFTLPISNNSEK